MGSSKHSRSGIMPVEIANVHGETDNNRAVDKRSPIGAWEVHSWGDGRLPGMAAVSAIATLQLGATLAEVPADKLALNKAAEYLINALAPQLGTFQRALAAD
jgi:hypothetical protein